MTFLSNILRASDRLLRAATFLSVSVSGALVLAIVFLATLDSVLSFFFNKPIPAATNFAEEILPAAVLLASGQVIRNRAEIVVDILTERMGARLRTVSTLIAGALSLIFFGLLSFGAVRLALASIELSETAVGAVAFPVWPMKIAFAVGLCISGLEALRIVLLTMAGKTVTTESAFASEVTSHG